MIAEEVLAAYPVRRHRRLLDVGGGEGAFLTAVAAAAPRLALTLFDLPGVAARAETALAVAGTGRPGAGRGRQRLRRSAARRGRSDHPGPDRPRPRRRPCRWRSSRPCVAALPADGTAAGWPSRWPAPPTRNRPGTPISGFYLLAMGSGRPRTAAELADLLRRAGFARLRTVATRRPDAGPGPDRPSLMHRRRPVRPLLGGEKPERKPPFAPGG